MMRRERTLAAVTLLCLVACDKSEAPTQNPQAEPPAASDAAAPADDGAGATEEVAELEPGAPSIPWPEKTFQQRKEFMGIVFYKEMKTMFRAHDAELYKKFTCNTCHGDDAKERNYAMPSDSIFPLSEDDPIGSAMDYDEAVTKFMMEQVVPSAAKMLDTEPYNPETGKGFGCFGCHPTE